MDAGNFLSQPELAQIYGAGNIDAIMQGRQQVGLANQFQQQGLEANTLANRKATLANQFDEANNPGKIQNQILQNQGLENMNTIGGVNARRATANEGMQLTQDQKDFALKASESDLKMAEDHAVGILQNKNASQMDKQAASTILDYTKAAVEARRKHLLDTQLEQVRGKNHLAGINAQTASNERIAQSNIEAGKFAKQGTGKDPVVVFNSMSPDKRIGISAMAMETGINPFTQQPLSPDEQRQWAAIHDQDVRTLDAKYAAQGQGIAAKVGPTGKIVMDNKKAPSVASTGELVGQTKSGTKFKVVE